MKTASGMIALFVALLAGATRADDVTKVPAFDQFLVVPLRIHVLATKEFDMTNTKITDAEVAKTVPALNAMWSKAGITFGLDSIVREPAGQLERFKALVKMNNGEFTSTDPFALLLPMTPSRTAEGLHVYIFHELPMNGFYLTGADAGLTREKPELNQVKGGSKDSLARVEAKLLGHALGLPNRDDDVGLLSSGTNGTGLSEVEIGQARQIARTIPGAFDVDDLAKQAEAAAKKKDTDKARRYYTWLTEVPGTGPGAAEAKKQLAALPAAKAK